LPKEKAKKAIVVERKVEEEVDEVR